MCRIKRKKRNSLIFIRDNGRFYPLTEYEYLSFKGVLFYGEIAKLIKEYINIYELGKKIVYNKADAFVLACEKVDNKQEFKLIKNNIEVDLKTFLETGEEKEKKMNTIYIIKLYLTCRNKTPLVSTMLESENNEKMIEFLKKSISIKYFLVLENTRTGEIIKNI